MKGNDLIVAAGIIIYASKSCEITTEAETIETASPDSATYRTYITGRKGWTVSTSYLVGENKWRSDLLRIGTNLTLRFRNRDEDTIMEGDAILTKCSITATRGNLTQGSFSFLGTGPLRQVY